MRAGPLACVAIGLLCAPGLCGEIVSVSGAVRVIDPPASVVPPEPQGREEEILLFAERAITLSSSETLHGFGPVDLVIDSARDIIGAETGPGGRIRSYFVVCTRGEGSARLEGSVTFSAPVLLYTWGDDLFPSLGWAGTEYAEPADAHPDFPAGFAFEPEGIGDVVALSEDRRTVSFSFNGWDDNPPDQLRIVVDAAQEASCWSEAFGGAEFDRLVLASAWFNGELYVGGTFSTIGGTSRARIARWDGVAWRSVGGGTNGSVLSLEVFDDGEGEALYVGGTFSQAGGIPVSRLARWDGESWSALEGGSPNNHVYALKSWDAGEGERLYAAGAFTQIGKTLLARIASWDGASWAPLDAGLTVGARALEVFDDGSGERLYAGGEFQDVSGVGSRGIAAWDGSAWGGVVGGVAGSVAHLRALELDSGRALIAGGEFAASAGGVAMSNIGAWDGASWSALGEGLEEPPAALAAASPGASGTELFVGGEFFEVNGVAARSIARWDGARWAPLREGVGGAVTHLAEDPATGEVLVFTGGLGEPPQAPARWMGCTNVCAGDLTRNGVVDFADLTIVLSSYGASGPDGAGDVDGDGVVGLTDLQLVLMFYGPCPQGCSEGVGGAPDCNENGVPDDCDIAQGTSFDCDGNGVPDECDVANGLGADCNGNGMLDACETAMGFAADCNGNQIPDECEPDCNGNGVPDDCDIASGGSADCNQNGVPDDCEPDCNGNGVLDECDVVSGASADCNGNLIPDECETDCDGNGVPDDCDIAAGAADVNNNGVPDICEAVGCPGDITGDGQRNTTDLNTFLAVYGLSFDEYPSADINRDHRIDFADLQILLHFFGKPCP